MRSPIWAVYWLTVEIMGRVWLPLKVVWNWDQAIDHRQWQAWGHLTLGLIYIELLNPGKAQEHFQNSRTIAGRVGSKFMSNFASGFLASADLLLDRPDDAAFLLPKTLSGRSVISDYSLLKAGVELALNRQSPVQALELLNRLDLPDRANRVGAIAYYYGMILLLREFWSMN